MASSRTRCNGVMMDMLSSVLQDFNDYWKYSSAFDLFIVSPHNPLNLSSQYFLAVLASSRHHCGYLVRQYEDRIRQQGCHSDWLRRGAGGSKVPASLRGLFHLNKLLAHRPWSVDGSVIQRSVWYDPNHPLSIGELMHAIYLIVHFHSLSGFIYGCGLEGPGVRLLSHCSLSSYPSLRCLFRDETTLPFSDELETSDEVDAKVGPSSNKAVKTDNRTGAEANHSRQFSDKAAEQVPAACSSKQTVARRIMGCAKGVPKPRKRQANYSDDLSQNTSSIIDDGDQRSSSFRYRPMRVREKLTHYLPLVLEQFSWDLCGMEIAETLYPDSAQFIDAKFKAALRAYPQSGTTKSEMGSGCSFASSDSSDSQDSFTSTCQSSDKFKKLRMMIWDYVQSQYGVITDDLSWCAGRQARRKLSESNRRRGCDQSSSPSRMNELLQEGCLPRPVKQYIRTVATEPEMLTKSDFEKVLKCITPKILVMINIVIKEARFQCELLYALRALHQYMQTTSIPSAAFT